MANKDVKANPNPKYLMALLTLIVFVIALFSVDAIVSYVINHFFPSLAHYIVYAWETSNALIGVLFSYVLYRILLSLVENHSNRRDVAAVELQKLIVRVIFSFIAVSIILTSFGVSLSGALAGGAIGGVIIGLAVQTITTSILSGFLVSTSRTLLPGDMVLLKSSSWGSIDLLVKITKVSTLYTEAITQNGNTMRFPNPPLLSSTVLTHLNKVDGSHLYPFQVIVNIDVPVAKFESKAKSKIGIEFKKRGFAAPEIVLNSKGTVGVPSNVYSVLVLFNDISEINELANIINHAFDEAYWSAKKQSK